MKKIIASLMMAAVGGLATTAFSSVVQPDALIVASDLHGHHGQHGLADV